MQPPVATLSVYSPKSLQNAFRHPILAGLVEDDDERWWSSDFECMYARHGLGDYGHRLVRPGVEGGRTRGWFEKALVWLRRFDLASCDAVMRDTESEFLPHLCVCDDGGQGESRIGETSPVSVHRRHPTRPHCAIFKGKSNYQSIYSQRGARKRKTDK